MPQVPSSNGRRFQRLALENTKRILHLSDRIGFFCFLCSFHSLQNEKCLFVSQLISDNKCVSKTADTFLLVVPDPLCFRRFRRQRISEQDLKTYCVHGLAFYFTGMCFLLHPVQVPAEGQTAAFP